MLHRWTRVGFLHWPYEPAAVQALLPGGLVADTFDGAAWIGLIPFHLTVRRPAWAPPVPWAGSTLEANVRTYVRGPDGRPGIWFLSLDASRLLAAVTARAWYRIPYTWARMRFRSGGDEIEYGSQRRWPGSSSAQMHARLRLGGTAAAADLEERDRFLICRWLLYTPAPGGLALTEVEHEPWPLRTATPIVCRGDVLPAAGLPEPEGSPLCHFSPGVIARFARRVATEVSQSSLAGP
jgi:uncharacterized protein